MAEISMRKSTKRRIPELRSIIKKLGKATAYQITIEYCKKHKIPYSGEDWYRGGAKEYNTIKYILKRAHVSGLLKDVKVTTEKTDEVNTGKRVWYEVEDGIRN